MSAEQGDAGAQFNLGIIYDNGKGVKQDFGEAVAWYRKAAEQGHAGAQFNLGFMYDNGRGVEENHSEAVAWYRKGAGCREGTCRCTIQPGLHVRQ